MAFVFDINELDLRELEDFADATGLDPMEIKDGWQPTLRAVRAFVWLVKRRSDPDFSLEDARRVKVRELVDLVPTDAGAGAGSDTSPSSATSTA